MFSDSFFVKLWRIISGLENFSNLENISLSNHYVLRWSRQREKLEQLTLQAVYNVTRQADEFIKEYLVAHEKVAKKWYIERRREDARG